jgi:hypothetical protein
MQFILEYFCSVQVAASTQLSETRVYQYWPPDQNQEQHG